MRRMHQASALTAAQAWAALRRTTEALANQVACPSNDTPDWSDEEWLIARAAAAMHGVSPLLARTSQWCGPASWHAFLNEQAAHVAARHARMELFVQRLDQEARKNGIALTALKGVALHGVGIYEAGERPMADIDLLARPEDAVRTGLLLEQLGFSKTLRTWKHDVYELPGECTPGEFGEQADNVIKVELHTRLSELLPFRRTEISDYVFSREMSAGINPYPSRAVFLMHLVLHAAGAMCFCALRIINLNDIARLSARMTEADWAEFLGLGSRLKRAPWWAHPPLALTARYYGSIPKHVLAHELLSCPRRLKRIVRKGTVTDVSLSNPRLSAFPGLEWSASVSEALLYMKARIKPGTDVLTGREYAARTTPPLRASSWAKMSQGRRIWKWLVARPPRQESLFALRSALGQRTLS